MGWGYEPHEGFADQRRPTGEWTGGTWRFEWGHATAQRAACSCGWRGDTPYPVPEAPELDAPEWAGYEAEADRVDALIHAEWSAEHYDAILGYEPAELLILGRDDGGPRFFLGGEPVYTGATLDLRLPDERWVPIRIEVEPVDDAERPWRPVAYMTLGGPAGAERHGDLPQVQFKLPAHAVLRRPERSR